MAHNANKLLYDRIICYFSHQKKNTATTINTHTQTPTNRKTKAVNGIGLTKLSNICRFALVLVDFGFPLSKLRDMQKCTVTV